MPRPSVHSVLRCMSPRLASIPAVIFSELMKITFASLVLLVPLARGQVGSIGIYTDFEQQPCDAVVSAMQAEVELLMSDAGMHLEWRSLRLATGRELFADLAVAKFKGNCSRNVFLPAHAYDGPLAWTHVSGGVVQSYADIDCDRIHDVIARELRPMPAATRDGVMGRAMGRVLAHELYHIFARSQTHGNREVDRPFFTPKQLTAESLADRQSGILRVGEHGILAEAEPRFPGIGSPQTGFRVYTNSGCSACHGLRGEGSKNGPPLLQDPGLLEPPVLAARLVRYGPAMLRRAQHLKIAPPSISAIELIDLASFLYNGTRNESVTIAGVKNAK